MFGFNPTNSSMATPAVPRRLHLLGSNTLSYKESSIIQAMQFKQSLNSARYPYTHYTHVYIEKITTKSYWNTTCTKGHKGKRSFEFGNILGRRGQS